jgi:hypothetical protein
LRFVVSLINAVFLILHDLFNFGLGRIDFGHIGMIDGG